MATLDFDLKKGKLAPADFTGKLRMVISGSQQGFLIEDLTGGFNGGNGATRMGNRFVLNGTDKPFIVKFTQTANGMDWAKVAATEVAKLNYKVLVLKNYKDVRICSDAAGLIAYGLEFGHKMVDDPEGRDFEACERFVRFSLGGLADFHVGLFHKHGQQAIRFYFQKN